MFCSQQLLPVVLLGASQHAVSPLRFVLDLLEEVRRAEDAHEAGRGEARPQPRQHGGRADTHIHTETPIARGSLDHVCEGSQSPESSGRRGVHVRSTGRMYGMALEDRKNRSSCPNVTLLLSVWRFFFAVVFLL